jgi:hypothetical protein
MEQPMLKPALSFFLLLTAPAFAQTPATGEEIRTAISGNTVQGSMSASGAYTEFYAADGTIKGKDYAGTWTIEGDAMCFAYGEAPDCWQAAISGDQITWIKDGAEGGTGTIVVGNPNNW